MKAVKIYTKDYCPYCQRAKAFLKQKSVAFEEQNIEGDLDFAENLFKKTGFRTVPQIFIGEECVGGYDNMMDLERQGVLDEKLGLK